MFARLIEDAVMSMLETLYRRIADCQSDDAGQSAGSNNALIYPRRDRPIEGGFQKSTVRDSYAVAASRPTATHSPQVAWQLWANACRASASAFAQAESQVCRFAVRSLTVGLL